MIIIKTFIFITCINFTAQSHVLHVLYYHSTLFSSVVMCITHIILP